MLLSVANGTIEYALNCQQASLLFMIPQYQQDFLAQLDFKLPPAYLTYLFSTESTYDFGASYLIEADELFQFNTDYEADEVYPGYFLIGASGGGEAFAMEKATGRFIQMPFIGHDEETPIILGLAWAEFLDYLKAEQP